MKSAIASVVAGLAVLAAVSTGPASAATYFGLYADENRSITTVSGTPYYSAEIWIWALPDEDGMMAAEFGMAYPSNVIPSTITWNSAISMKLGSLPGGISVAFSACQEGWTWIAHQTIWVMNEEYSEVKLVPPSGATAIQIATCGMGYPIEPASVLSGTISLNCESLLESLEPKLTSVEAVAPNVVLATFSEWLASEAYWFPEPHHFRVMSLTSPPETLAVLEAWFNDGYNYTIRLVLGENLVPNTSYVLEAYEICHNIYSLCCVCYCLACADSEMEFTSAPIATLLAGSSVELVSGGIQVSWSLGAPADGISFLPARRESGDSAFEPLAADVIEDGTLSYRFVDANVRPGTTVKYAIDCVIDGERSALFETEWVETPAARFALHQNLPNPFNPSTRVAFELGEPCRTTLFVYDVSGKLVRTLIDETLPAGAHDVEWDGRDGAGRRCASGIYFYRLRAGSFAETKKMVLLR